MGVIHVEVSHKGSKELDTCSRNVLFPYSRFAVPYLRRRCPDHTRLLSRLQMIGLRLPHFVHRNFGTLSRKIDTLPWWPHVQRMCNLVGYRRTGTVLLIGAALGANLRPLAALWSVQKISASPPSERAQKPAHPRLHPWLLPGEETVAFSVHYRRSFALSERAKQNQLLSQDIEPPIASRAWEAFGKRRRGCLTYLACLTDRRPVSSSRLHGCRGDHPQRGCHGHRHDRPDRCRGGGAHRWQDAGAQSQGRSAKAEPSVAVCPMPADQRHRVGLASGESLSCWWAYREPSVPHGDPTLGRVEPCRRGRKS